MMHTQINDFYFRMKYWEFNGEGSHHDALQPYSQENGNRLHMLPLARVSFSSTSLHCVGWSISNQNVKLLSVEGHRAAFHHLNKTSTAPQLWIIPKVA
jgi:hypothetical protein